MIDHQQNILFKINPYVAIRKGRITTEHIKDMFARMDLAQIRQFLLYGVEEATLTEHSYMERLRIGSEPILAKLKKLHPDQTEFDMAVSDLSHALTAHETVYFEMGMKAGARLICQLLLADDKDFSKR